MCVHQLRKQLLGRRRETNPIVKAERLIVANPGITNRSLARDRTTMAKARPRASALCANAVSLAAGLALLGGSHAWRGRQLPHLIHLKSRQLLRDGLQNASPISRLRLPE